MRDLALFLILAALVWAAWRRPWLGVLGLTVLAFMHPQGYATGGMKEFPAYLVLFAAVSLATIKEYAGQRAWPKFWWDWRIALIVLLYAWFLYTTQSALAPLSAQLKFVEVGKVLLPLILMLLLIDAREKLFGLLVVMALSIVLVALKGGYWALMTGFQDRVYGPPGSQIYGNNEFAVATAMAIPLLVLWLREARDRVLRGVIMVAIGLCYASALSSWSRGGVLSLSVMTLLVLWHTRSKLLALPLLALGGVLMAELLPEKWFGRMHTITGFAGDESALGRLRAWEAAWAFVREHPLAGAGFEGWRFITRSESGQGGGIDWHSAYVEILVEHGAVGLLLWGLLLAWTLAALTRLAWRGRRLNQPWLTSYGTMLRASLAAYLTGALTLGISYWELLYLLLGAAILLGRLAREPGQPLAPGEVSRSTGWEEGTR